MTITLTAPWRGPKFRRTSSSGFRAVTLGPSHDDWAVIDARGRVVYRGYMLYAARLATELSQAA